MYLRSSADAGSSQRVMEHWIGDIAEDNALARRYPQGASPVASDMVVHGSAEQVKERLRKLPSFGVNELLAIVIEPKNDNETYERTVQALGGLAAEQALLRSARSSALPAQMTNPYESYGQVVS